MARSTFYYQLAQSKKSDKWADVKGYVFSIYHKNRGRYGYRRITQALFDEYHLVVNHKTVKRLMDDLGIKSVVRIKKYKSYKGEVGHIAPNILQRDFSTTWFNQKWVTDVTEFHLLGCKVYLSPITELYNGEVLGYTISDHPDLDMVLSMVEKVLKKYPQHKGVILHSDQGSLYQAMKYQRKIAKAGIIQSMSRKGNCYDNACAESLFSQLKAEFDYSSFDTVEQFKSSLEEYIKYYNEERIKSKLGTSPAKYRARVENIA